MGHIPPMKKRLYLSIIFLLILATTRTQADTVTMVTVDWSPFYGAELPKQGYVTEIARQAFKRKGHRMEISFFPWTRAMHVVKSGQYHGLFGCWANQEVRRDYQVSEESMATGDAHFLSIKDIKFGELATQGELRPENIIGLKVGIVRGYPVSETLEQFFRAGLVTKIEVNRVKQLIEMIKWNDRIHLILENNLVIKHNFEKYYPDKKYNIKIVGKDYVDGGLYICWSKKNPIIPALRNDFDEAIREMRQDGTITKIEKEFGVITP